MAAATLYKTWAQISMAALVILLIVFGLFIYSR